MTIDVFLESFDLFDRDAVEVALARNGIGDPDAPIETADGGSALVTVDDESCTFFIKSLTPDLSQIILDVARVARLAILPADGTATTLLPRKIEVPETWSPCACERSSSSTKPCERVSADERRNVELLRPESVADAVAGARERVGRSRRRDGARATHARADRRSPTRSSSSPARSTKGVSGNRDQGPERRWPSSRRTRPSPTRCARPAACRRHPSCATSARSAATSCRRRAAGTGGWKFPCRLHGGDICHAREGEHREHAIFANDFCASAHPSDPAAALLALGATIRTDRGGSSRSPTSTACRPRTTSATTTLAKETELILELDVPRPDAVVVPQGDGPPALVVCARRRRGGPLRGGDAHRPGRRRAHPVADRRGRGAGLGEPAAADGVEGAARPRARPACRSRRSTSIGSTSHVPQLLPDMSGPGHDR